MNQSKRIDPLLKRAQEHEDAVARDLAERIAEHLQQRGIRSRKLASPQLLPQIHRRRIERHDACHIGGASAPRHHDHVLAGHLPDFEFFAYLHLSNVLIFAKV